MCKIKSPVEGSLIKVPEFRFLAPTQKSDVGT